MRVLCKDQNSVAWDEARKGRITASNAKFCLAKPGTKGRRMYIEKLVADLQGIPDFDDEEPAPWFAAGRYYEAWARGWYSWEADVEVTETGFIVHDEYSFIGCSPDGLIGDDGLLEIKYRTYLHTFKQHAAKGANAAVLPQIQTQMFVCDRPWCDYVNYWRDDNEELEQGSIERIHRDDSYINNTLLPAFVKLWGEVQTLLKQRESG